MEIFIIKAAISSFLASYAFGILFNIKRDKLVYAGITGMVGGILYKLGIYYEYGEYISNFVGAIGLSIGAEMFARYKHAPVTVFLVCALIPLVPGGYLYRMMNQAMHGFVQVALTTGMQMLAIALVLATGILIVSSVFGIYSKYKK